jgi:tetratricopeptide (TPR) repeat protein
VLPFEIRALMKLLSSSGDRAFQVCAGFALLLAVISLGNVSAQTGPSTFEEVAAEAAAARDVNDAPRAIQLYSEAVQLNPKWQEGWWFLGVLQYESRAYPSAIGALSHAIAIDANAGQALALRGLCEFETGDYLNSLTDIEKGILLDPAKDGSQEQILRYHEAMLLTRLGTYQDALQKYAPFAEHHLTSPELLMAIGLAGLRIPLLPRETSPEQRPLLSAVGEAAYKFMEGDENAAREAFNNLFQRFPSARNAHLLYGNLLLAFGPDAAAPQFKKELEVAPDSDTALNMLAWTLLMENRAEEALPYAIRIAQQQPERAASQLMLGRALLDTSDLPGGIEHLKRGLKLEPDNLEIHIALAKAYSKSGRDDDARRERARCLEMTENHAAGQP